MKNLTKDQKKFAVIGMISVIGVFVLLFFVNGLSQVDYSSSSTSSEDKLLKNLNAAMDQVVEMEYESYALYNAAIEAHGDIAPFFNIVGRESMNLGNLITMYDTYGFELPENKHVVEDVKLAKSVKGICADALALELEHNEVYNSVKLDALGFVDVEATFWGFRSAANERYIPELQACSDAA